MLEHHADVAAHRDDLFRIIGELDAVDDDAAGLPVLQMIDAAQQGRLAAAGWATDDDALAERDFQIDVTQYMKFAEPFVQGDDFNRYFGARRLGTGIFGTLLHCQAFQCLPRRTIRISARAAYRDMP